MLGRPENYDAGLASSAASRGLILSSWRDLRPLGGAALLLCRLVARLRLVVSSRRAQRRRLSLTAAAARLHCSGALSERPQISHAERRPGRPSIARPLEGRTFSRGHRRRRILAAVITIHDQRFPEAYLTTA
jgi:hypothetical protein